MNRMRSKYQVLAAVMLLVAVLCLLIWLVGVRPHRVRAREELGSLVDKRKSLRKRGWPLDREVLERLLGERTRLLDGAGAGAPGLKLRSEQVQQHATAMFRNRIQKEFQNPESSIRNASNIDFREAFNVLQRRLAGEGIWVAPEVLNLSEESSVPYTYQLLLQVWTLERLADLVLANHLSVLAEPTVKVRTGGGEQAAARIALQPIVAYYLESESPLPYLLGIPVRVRLSGELADVRRFLMALTAGDTFLPPVQAEVYAEDPRGLRGRADEPDSGGKVILDVTCSAFFAFPGGDTPPPAKAAPAAKQEAAEGA